MCVCPLIGHSWEPIKTRAEQSLYSINCDSAIKLCVKVNWERQIQLVSDSLQCKYILERRFYYLDRAMLLWSGKDVSGKRSYLLSLPSSISSNENNMANLCAAIRLHYWLVKVMKLIAKARVKFSPWRDNRADVSRVRHSVVPSPPTGHHSFFWNEPFIRVIIYDFRRSVHANWRTIFNWKAPERKF